MLAPALMVAPVQATPSAPGSAARYARVCPVSRSHDRVGCFAWVRTDVTGRPMVTPSVPSGYGPAQFHTAYQLPTTSPKTNQTIGIVDAFNDPNVFADLKKYDAAFGLPAFPKCSATRMKKCLSVLNQNGPTSPLPAGDTGWGLEISLDVQVAHAICQNCKIMLVEASSDEFSDIEIAVNTAVAKGAKVVSNSYGDYGNDCAEPGYDHPHVAMVVSSGDSGYQVSCPAVLSTVVSVGGTRLTLGAGDAYVVRVRVERQRVGLLDGRDQRCAVVADIAGRLGRHRVRHPPGHERRGRGRGPGHRRGRLRLLRIRRMDGGGRHQPVGPAHRRHLRAGGQPGHVVLRRAEPLRRALDIVQRRHHRVERLLRGFALQVPGGQRVRPSHRGRDAQGPRRLLVSPS